MDLYYPEKPGLPDDNSDDSLSCDAEVVMLHKQRTDLAKSANL